MLTTHDMGKKEIHEIIHAKKPPPPTKSLFSPAARVAPELMVDWTPTAHSSDTRYCMHFGTVLRTEDGVLTTSARVTNLNLKFCCGLRAPLTPCTSLVSFREGF